MIHLRQKTAIGILWSAAQSWGTRLFSFFVMLALARLLKPEAFGLVAYATVFIALIDIFIDQGFNDALVQCPEIQKEHLDTAFWITIITSIVFMGVGIISSGLIAQIFHEPQLAPIIRWLSIDFLINAFSGVQAAILRRKLAFKSLAIRSFVATILSGIVAVVMAFLGFGVWSLVGKLITASVVSAITLWKISDWRPGFHVSIQHFKELFSYGINIVGSNFVNFFSLHGDDFLIGYFLGSTALGYYTLAYNLLIVMTDFLVSVPNTVLFPALSRLQNEQERFKRSFFEVSQLQSIITFPVFFGISVTATEIVYLLYGQKWSPSIPVIQLLMLVGVIRTSTLFYSSVIKASGKPVWRLWIWTTSAVLNIIGFLIAVRYGIVAVAGAYLCAEFLVLPFYYYVIHKLIDVSIREHLKQLLPALVASLFMVAFVVISKYLVKSNTSLPINLLMYVTGGAFIYFVVIRVVLPSAIKKIVGLISLTRAGIMNSNAYPSE